MSTVIRAKNVSKQYRLGKVGTGTLSHDLNRWWHRIRGKEDPYLKIGESNDRTAKGGSEYVWALRDINFDIEQGATIGIIGRNGAGKSTLLKILSRTTAPTTGSIKVRGRVASLLEVGTGFHPELSGRENTYLNGAILGMTRKEISRKFDEIVDFAGVERYIDTPVKRYSSGMYVRLAFAVAAHLESEILIVDEVLAVGDAEFQEKCIGKMGSLRNTDGRTILFVSHNIPVINKLCDKSILLEKGLITHFGDTRSTIEMYLKNHNSQVEKNINNLELCRKYNSGELYITKVEIFNNRNDNSINFGEQLVLVIEVNYLRQLNELAFDAFIKNDTDIGVAQAFIRIENENITDEERHFRYKVTINNTLKPGKYYLDIGIHRFINGNTIENLENCLTFTVLNLESNGDVILPHFLDFRLGYNLLSCSCEVLEKKGSPSNL